MPYFQPPNSNTWEKLQGPLFGLLRGPLHDIPPSLSKHFRLPLDVSMWLVDQAIESLANSPYDTEKDRSVGQEAIIIAIKLGYITDPEYIQMVHERCVRRANQCK